MNKFLIINPFGIGDVLFTTPVIRTIKEKHPDSLIGYWCNERVGELLKSVPDIDKIFPLSRGDIKRVYGGLKKVVALISLIGRIRREKFDVAFDFSLDSRYGLWSMLAGIKKRIGLNYKNRGRFLTDKIYLKTYSGKHVIEYNLDLLRFVNIEPKNKSPELIISEEDKASVRNMLKEHGVLAADLLIGMAPGGGASWGKDAIYKQWPAEKFAEVASRLIKDLNVKVVLLGSVEEKPIAEIMEKTVLSCPRKRASINEAPMDSRLRGNDNELNQTVAPTVVNLTGKLNLKELAAIISELKLLICNDGGPLHMAVALGVKTVSMFGPVDEKVYGPYPSNEKHVVIKKDLPCRPCYEDFKFTGCSNSRKCLEDITVEEAFEKAKQLI